MDLERERSHDMSNEPKLKGESVSPDKNFANQTELRRFAVAFIRKRAGVMRKLVQFDTKKQ